MVDPIIYHKKWGWTWSYTRQCRNKQFMSPVNLLRKFCHLHLGFRGLAPIECCAFSRSQCLGVEY
jgi:hypothetical protein